MAEVLRYKELLLNLTAKDLKLKYKHSAIGFLWSFLNPLLMLLIYTFAFKTILKISIPNFPVFLLCGILPWSFFQMSTQGGSMSVISAGGLIKKVYFAREVIPLSLTLANFFDFLMTLVVLLLAAFVVFHLRITANLLLLPLILLLLFFFTSGISMAVAALNVRYRDISHFVEVFFMFFFYLTPIIYSMDMIPEAYRGYLYLNPMVPFILFIRDIILEGMLPPLNLLLMCMGWTVLAFVFGILIFTRREPYFAEDV